MSQIPSQTETYNFFAPIYTRKELERKLRELNEKLEEIFNAMHSILSLLDDIYSYLYNKDLAKPRELDKIRVLKLELESTLEDIIDAVIVRELRLDTDIGMYEKQYGVRFTYEAERQLGVALVRENNTIKPVVIWTDYDEVWYIEGERDE